VEISAFRRAIRDKLQLAVDTATKLDVIVEWGQSIPIR
jgi:hypothetical protein